MCPTKENPSPKGKGRALNAFKHGLTGRLQFFSDAEREVYDIHSKGIHQSFAPANPFETGLVQQIADDRWRLQSIFGIEQAIFADGLTQTEDLHEHPEIDIALSRGRVWVKEAKNFNLLTLYERRIQNNLERNLKILQQSQAARQEALERAAEQALLLAEQARKKGQVFNIEKDFPLETVLPQFVFSGPQIARAAARQVLFRKAA